MGTIFESNPTIKGKTPHLSSQEKLYFNRVNTILKENYNTNLYSDDNLLLSFEAKSFTSNNLMPPNKNQIQDISWLEYLLTQLKNFSVNYNNASWINELRIILNKECFYTENKYLSQFFYAEFFIKTFPKKLEQDKNFEENTEKKDEISILNNINDTEYNELDVTDNLGGSYLEMNIDELQLDDATYQYKQKRKRVKKYIKFFKEYIYNNLEHPINRVINLFIKSFCKYINIGISKIENQLINKEKIEDDYSKKISDFEQEITSSLRDFILATHISLKLFYSTSIDLSFFQEEKDDLINLLTSLFFKTGTLYEKIYNLYKLAYSAELENLQDRLINLKNVKPKNLGVDVRFCLDEDTCELQKNVLAEKQKENEKNENKDKDPKIEKQISEKIKPTKNQELFQIKEEKEQEDEDVALLESNEKFNKDNDNNQINTSNDENIISTKNNDINTNENNNGLNLRDDEYILEKINVEMSEDFRNDILTGGFAHLRNTVNCFNNKTYLFPKLHKNLRNTLNLNEKYINEAKNSGKLPIPYYTAINLLKSIKKYKTPFEKIVILAALSDEVTQSVSTFWEKMKNYIKNSFLFIEADELMAIFLFIVIKAQISEIFIDSKIVTNFTTPTTRAFNISYNLTLFEASLDCIFNMKNIKDLAKCDKELKEVRKSLAAISTQRLSRLSRLSNNIGE